MGNKMQLGSKMTLNRTSSGESSQQMVEKAIKSNLKSKQINFDIDENLHKKVRMKSITDNITVSDFLRQKLEEWVSS